MVRHDFLSFRLTNRKTTISCKCCANTSQIQIHQRTGLLCKEKEKASNNLDMNETS